MRLSRRGTRTCVFEIENLKSLMAQSKKNSQFLSFKKMLSVDFFSYLCKR